MKAYYKLDIIWGFRWCQCYSYRNLLQWLASTPDVLCDAKVKAGTGLYIHYSEVYLQDTVSHLNKYNCEFIICFLTQSYGFSWNLFTFSTRWFWSNSLFLKVKLHKTWWKTTSNERCFVGKNKKRKWVLKYAISDLIYCRVSTNASNSSMFFS